MRTLWHYLGGCDVAARVRRQPSLLLQVFVGVRRRRLVVRVPPPQRRRPGTARIVDEDEDETRAAASGC